MELNIIANITMGQSPASSSYNKDGDGLPFFQGNADFGIKYPVTRVWCSSPKKIAHKGDILISVRAPIGAINIANCDCCIGRGLASIKVNEKKYNNDYVYTYLKASSKKLNQYGTGSTFKAINKRVLCNFDVPDLSYNEQSQFMMKVDCLSQILDSKREQLEKLDLLIKARFVEILASNEYKKERFGNNIAEMFIGPFGSSLKNSCFVDKDSSFCMVYEQKHAIHKTLNLPTRYVDKSKYEELKRFSLKGDDIIISCRGTIGEVYQLPHDAPIGIMHPSIMKISYNKDKYNGVFLVKLLEEHMIKTEHMAKGSGVKMAVKAKDLKEELFYLPPLKIQNQFADFVTQVEKVKADVQKSLDKTQMLFDSLMQEYFG